MLDLAVVLSYSALYFGVVGTGLAGWVYRNFPADRGWWVPSAAVLLVSLVVSGLGVATGELWSGAIEIIRVGNGHLSYRALRVPWIQHRPVIFAAGVILFGLIALFRYRRASADYRAARLDPGHVLRAD